MRTIIILLTTLFVLTTSFSTATAQTFDPFGDDWATENSGIIDQDSNFDIVMQELGFGGLNQELGIGAIGQVSGFGTITEEDWIQECMEQGSLQWECSLAWDVPLVMAQILGEPGYDGVGSYIVSETTISDLCGDAEDCIVVTGQRINGHDFETSNVVCRDASLVSLEDQQNTMAWFTVPRHFGYIVDVRIGTAGETRYFVTHPDTGAPGGWITSELSLDGLSGINTTVPGRHFFSRDS